MPVFAEYAVRETASNLWRNRLMTIAAVLTVAVSLALVGSALLLKQGAANAEAEWQRGTQVTIWMVPTASPSEIAAVGSQLKTLPYVNSSIEVRPTTIKKRANFSPLQSFPFFNFRICRRRIDAPPTSLRTPKLWRTDLLVSQGLDKSPHPSNRSTRWNKQLPSCSGSF